MKIVYDIKPFDDVDKYEIKKYKNRLVDLLHKSYKQGEYRVIYDIYKEVDKKAMPKAKPIETK